MATNNPWSQNLKLVPNITQVMIDQWADEIAKVPRAKQTKGYSNFIEGYIHDLEVFAAEKKVKLRAKAYPSMRKNNPPYKLMVTLSTEGTTCRISSSECECKAGNGHCSHCIGLLYLVCHFKKLGLSAVPPVQSKTSLPQTWHIPARSEGLTPRCVDRLEISKVKPKGENLETSDQHMSAGPKKKRKRVTEGILPNIYCPVRKPIPIAEFTESLKSNLHAIGSDAQILKILPSSRLAKVDTTFGPVPVGSPLSYQQKLVSNTHIKDIINHPGVAFPRFSMPVLTCIYTTVLSESEFNKFMGLQVSAETSYETEEQTRHQSHNKIWHDVRKNRLTSSIFKDVCSRKSDFDALAERLLKAKNIMTAEMKFGIENEPFAAEAYCHLTGNSSYLCGFIINPSAPHLGASPDRKVFDENATPQYGLLEIKCPSKDSFMDCPYLMQNTSTGVYKLKHSHKYFCQIMGQMALTGMTWCDFFVKCRKDYHLERVYFDESKWSCMKEGLDTFYFDVLLPKICHVCRM